MYGAQNVLFPITEVEEDFKDQFSPHPSPTHSLVIKEGEPTMRK